MKIVTVVLLVLLAVAPVWADDDDARRDAVQLVTDPKAVAGCGQMLATISDDDLNDFKKKAVKKGGNTILITGQSAGLSLPGPYALLGSGKDKVNGLVYACPDGWPVTVTDAAVPAASTNHILEERLLMLEKRILKLEQERAR